MPLRHLSTLLLSLFIVCAIGTAVSAHAGLISSDPASDAVLDAPPEIIALRFNEPVSPLALGWLLPDGTQKEAESDARGDVLYVVSPGTDAGTYILSWRVASADGHPVAGALMYSLGSVSRVAADLPTVSPMVWVAAALRAALFAALAFGAGGAAQVALSGQMAGRPAAIGRLAALAVFPIAAAAFLLHHSDRGGGAWLGTLASPYGMTLGFSVLSSVAALLAFRHGWRMTGLVAWALAAWALAASGHTRAALSFGIAVAALHGLALVFWIGGLPVLLSTDLARLRRFSALALPMVVVLLGSGVVMTLVLVPDVGTALSHPWALILGAKLVLVAAMLALALRNRLVLTPALATGAPEAAPRLVRAIRGEIALGAAVLFLAAMFRVSGPPVAAAPQRDAFVHIHSEEVMVDLAASPGAPGTVLITLGFATGDMLPLTPVAAQIDMTDPALGIGPIRVDAVQGEDGIWRAGPVTLPVAGPWQVSLDIRVSDFRQVTLSGELLLDDGSQ